MNVWKVVGLAGLTGVATTGVIIARNQRTRANLSAEQVRARLHERVEAAARDGQDPGSEPVGGPGNPGSTESSARA